MLPLAGMEYVTIDAFDTILDLYVGALDADIDFIDDFIRE